MNSTVERIEEITEWLNDNVLNIIKLKKQIKSTSKNVPDSYESVNPRAYSMFFPLNPNNWKNAEGSSPSVLVRFDESFTYPQSHSGMINIQLILSVYNPGNSILEEEDFQAEGNMDYIRSTDGWKDLHELASLIENKLIAAGEIGGMELNQEKGIKVKPYIENGIFNFYPNFFADMYFSLDYYTVADRKDKNRLYI